MPLLKLLITFSFVSFFSNQLNAKEDDAKKHLLDDVLASYEKLHNAYFSQDKKAIKKFAQQTAKEIKKIEKPEIKELLAYTVETLKKLDGSENEEQRHQYLDVASRGIMNVLDKHQAHEKYKPYYCPMVRLHWLQNIEKQEKTHNPYAPETMPHCGSKI